MFPHCARVFTGPPKGPADRSGSKWASQRFLAVSSGQSLHGCRLRQWPGCGYGNGHLLSTVNGGLKLRKEVGKCYSRFNDVVKPVALLAKKDASFRVGGSIAAVKADAVEAGHIQDVRHQ